jgi:urease accessory protein
VRLHETNISVVARRSTKRWLAMVTGAAMSCFVPAGQALAHVQSGDSGLLTGLLHPVGGLDHVLAMVLVGIWGAQLGRPAIWMLPIAFPTVMAIGGLAGLLGINLAWSEIAIAVSVVTLGLMVAFSMRPALALAFAIVGGFALFHGYAHGTELPPGESGLLYSLGFVVATGCLHGVGVLIGLLNKVRGGEMMLRGLGAAAGMAGLYLLHGVVT